MIIANKQVVYQSENLRELQSKLENIAFDYVCKIEVIPEKYFEPSKSHQFKSHPYGHFMVKKPDKITIYYKFLSRGFFYNTNICKKIITFCLIRPSRKEYINHFEILKIDDVLLHTSRFSEIHSELLENQLLKNIISHFEKEE